MDALKTLQKCLDVTVSEQQTWALRVQSWRVHATFGVPAKFATNTEAAVCVDPEGAVHVLWEGCFHGRPCC
jgi:uncharacterized protein YecE (DUF72 family)